SSCPLVNMLSKSRPLAGAVLGTSLLMLLAHAIVNPAPTAPAAEEASAVTAPSVPWNVALELGSVARTDSITHDARSLLRREAARFALEQRDLEALEHRDTYVDRSSGARIVRFGQVL